MRIASANFKQREAELEYVAKNNRHMLHNLQRVNSMLETKEELKDHFKHHEYEKMRMSKKVFWNASD